MSTSTIENIKFFLKAPSLEFSSNTVEQLTTFASTLYANFFHSKDIEDLKHASMSLKQATNILFKDINEHMCDNVDSPAFQTYFQAINQHSAILMACFHQSHSRPLFQKILAAADRISLIEARMFTDLGTNLNANNKVYTKHNQVWF